MALPLDGLMVSGFNAFTLIGTGLLVGLLWGVASHKEPSSNEVEGVSTEKQSALPSPEDLNFFASEPLFPVEHMTVMVVGDHLVYLHRTDSVHGLCQSVGVVTPGNGPPWSVIINQERCIDGAVTDGFDDAQLSLTALPPGFEAVLHGSRTLIPQQQPSEI